MKKARRSSAILEACGGEVNHNSPAATKAVPAWKAWAPRTFRVSSWLLA